MEVEKLERRHHESAIQGVSDKFDCLMSVMATCETIQEVINKLESLFSDDSVVGFQLSSTHRAKGLESENVYVLTPEKFPLVWRNMQQWEIDQENNIKYVMLTRSRNKLVFVQSTSKN